jgi:hypothetical protein
MNPLSDWFVDDRAIVDHQQRLLDERDTGHSRLGKSTPRPHGAPRGPGRNG